MKYIKTFESHRSSKYKNTELEPVNEEIFGLLKKLKDGLMAGLKDASKLVKDYVNKTQTNLKTFTDEITGGKIKSEDEAKKKIKEKIDFLASETKKTISAAPDDIEIQKIIQQFEEQIKVLEADFINSAKTVKNESVKNYGNLIQENITTQMGAVVAVLRKAAAEQVVKFKEEQAKLKDLAAKKTRATKFIDEMIAKFKSTIDNKEALAKAEEEFNKVNGIQSGGSFKIEDLKPGDMIIYKREKFNEKEWNELKPDQKKDANKMKEFQDKEMIGIKKFKELKGDVVSFQDADFTKKKEDILGKSEAKAPGQEELIKTLVNIKGIPNAVDTLRIAAQAIEKDPKAIDKIKETFPEEGK